MSLPIQFIMLLFSFSGKPSKDKQTKKQVKEKQKNVIYVFIATGILYLFFMS